jgi:hypothetical protein
MLIPLAVAGALLLTVGRRCYPTDVATAMESEEAVRAAASQQDDSGPD